MAHVFVGRKDMIDFSSHHIREKSSEIIGSVFIGHIDDEKNLCFEEFKGDCEKIFVSSLEDVKNTLKPKNIMLSYRLNNEEGLAELGESPG